ncbi:glycosyl transferase [Fischerella thermalis WC442]|uniref:glycosyltransferase family protein n=2 Tax=Fischerella thermalis TaxID=372787 RepID=UPI000C80D2F7|nr:glycosyltransferase [Fischerella thermalis]PLZ37939.1 glycosyl transferase [Fischerella thermalis WC558]PLZ49660.1 glycosyl transferase [Fischerella thermalis WC442]PLZ53007.1 glycosyl transferase [Fischerella thermalis WC439]PMB33936.1 glycosyl transferase [Fischerella thermalis CCMEE 5208]
MKKLMFYCQHILGMGHLVRSMEIVRGLTKDFHICFINGGEVIPEFQVPSGVEVVNLPAIKTDPEFKELQVVDHAFTLTEVQEIRKNLLLSILDKFQPDILMIELFPFGRRRFSFELIPMLEKVQASQSSTKVVCSLRDIVVTKQNQARHEEKVCKLINQYFDLLLVHSDPKFVSLEETFSRIQDFNCQVYYTGYVVQKTSENPVFSDEDKEIIESEQPLILVSVGGGRFGHELLDCVVKTAPLLEKIIPHNIQVFTGPFIPDEKFQELQTLKENSNNLRIRRYTPYFLNYMQKADLSISMSGYNTTLNILTTGVRAMILPFTGNNDQEQTIRSQKLNALGITKTIYPQDLQPDIFAWRIISYLEKQINKIKFDFNGVENTAKFLKDFVYKEKIA